jgi:hypothetical protein
MKHIDDLYYHERGPNEWKNWSQSLKKPNINLWIKNNGSVHSKDWPYMLLEVEFNKSYTLD